MIDFSNAIAPITNFELYERDIAYLKQYNEFSYKVVLMKSVRRAGYVERDGCIKGKKNTAGRENKFDSSISRTKARIYELALCNEWEWFGTFTLSPDGHDRYDIEFFKKQFPKWIRNLNSYYSIDIKYLLVPEQHKDGAWHMHGLFKGIPDNWLCRFSAADNVPSDLVVKDYYNWPAYSQKFGYVSLGRVQNLEATAKYITKYITKELEDSPVGLNKHLYFSSRGLKRAKTILRAPVSRVFEPDFSNDYVAIKTFKSYKEAIKLFVSENYDTEPITFENIVPYAGIGSCYSDGFESVFENFLSELKNAYSEVNLGADIVSGYNT